jgi:hypothetical protein
MQADWHIGLRWGSLKEVKLDGDGKITVGAAKAEVVSQPGEAEGEGAVGEELPQVDLGVLKAAIKAPSSSGSVTQKPREFNVPPKNPSLSTHSLVDDNSVPYGEEDDPHTLVVKLSVMPEESSYVRFMALLTSRPGKNTVLMRTPEGELLMDWISTSLTPSNQPEISLALGGAEVFFELKDVDPASVMSGIQL